MACEEGDFPAVQLPDAYGVTGRAKGRFDVNLVDVRQPGHMVEAGTAQHGQRNIGHGRPFCFPNRS
jgi:hypothetical protein